MPMRRLAMRPRTIDLAGPSEPAEDAAATRSCLADPGGHTASCSSALPAHSAHKRFSSRSSNSRMVSKSSDLCMVFSIVPTTALPMINHSMKFQDLWNPAMRSSWFWSQPTTPKQPSPLEDCCQYLKGQRKFRGFYWILSQPEPIVLPEHSLGSLSLENHGVSVDYLPTVTLPSSSPSRSKTVNGGFPHTEESKAKISAANKGKVPWNKGRQHSEETKRRIGEKTRKAMQDPKVLEKLRMNQLGKKHNDETRAKIKAALGTEEVQMKLEAARQRRREALEQQKQERMRAAEAESDRQAKLGSSVFALGTEASSSGSLVSDLSVSPSKSSLEDACFARTNGTNFDFVYNGNGNGNEISKVRVDSNEARNSNGVHSESEMTGAFGTGTGIWIPMPSMPMNGARSGYSDGLGSSSTLRPGAATVLDDDTGAALGSSSPSALSQAQTEERATTTPSPPIRKALSAETKAKLSAAIKLKWQDPEYRARHAASMKDALVGRTLSEEHKEKIRSTLIARNAARSGGSDFSSDSFLRGRANRPGSSRSRRPLSKPRDSPSGPVRPTMQWRPIAQPIGWDEVENGDSDREKPETVRFSPPRTGNGPGHTGKVPFDFDDDDEEAEDEYDGEDDDEEDPSETLLQRYARLGSRRVRKNMAAGASGAVGAAKVGASRTEMARGRLSSSAARRGRPRAARADEIATVTFKRYSGGKLIEEQVADASESWIDPRVAFLY